MTEYDIKITIKKGLIAFAIGGITALIAWFAQMPPEAVGGAVTVAVVTALAQSIMNWIKHRDQTV